MILTDYKQKPYNPIARMMRETSDEVHRQADEKVFQQIMSVAEQKPIQLWEILVPTVRNKPLGKKVYYTTRYHRQWDVRVRAITGGLTVLSPVKGQWISPDKKLFSERMIPVRIACDEQQIEQIADMTAQYYEQQAVMYYKISDCVRINRYYIDDNGDATRLGEYE